MQPVSRIESRTIVLPIEDIDTDQIIPARFLTTTSRQDLGRHLFADWRFRADGSEDPEFALNLPEARDRTVLVAGRNFGCGSSREHAAWALQDFGIQAVISSEVADIFRTNALKNGLLPIVVDPEILRELINAPGSEVSIDIAASTLSLHDGREIDYPIDSFARHCLLEGIDQLGFLQQHLQDIENFERSRPWMP